MSKNKAAIKWITFGQEEGERRKARRVEEALGVELLERVDVVLRLRKLKRRHFLELRSKQRREQFAGCDQFGLR